MTRNTLTKSDPSSRGSRRRRSLISALLTLLLTCGAGIGEATPATAAYGSSLCSYAIFIGVRGTDAPAGTTPIHGNRVWLNGGYGSQVQSLRELLVGLPDMPFYTVSLNYPATAADYVPGMNANRARLVDEINYVSQQCPWNPIILSGHSQGADVVLSALTVMPNQPNLTSQARQSIMAVPVFGDPTFIPNKGYNDAYPGTGWGVNPRLNTTELDAMKFWGFAQGATTQKSWVYRIRSYCKNYDYFCQSNLTNNGMLIHSTYSVNMAATASWVQYMLTDFN